MVCVVFHHKIFSEVKKMNSKMHLAISLVKSGIRIVGCCVALRCQSLTILILALLAAEILGVLEELFDER